MSDFSQYSFIGGMNLQIDDTRLPDNQYRCGFNVRNRYDILTLIPDSIKDLNAPQGVKQELVTFGNYIIMFVAGFCYYRYYTDVSWTKLPSFRMSFTAPRYWTCMIPLTLTNYIRKANDSTHSIGGGKYASSVNGGVQLLTLQGAAQGNTPGLIVQDNESQPQFIFLDDLGTPQCRTTQTYDQWMIGYTTNANTVIGPESGVANVKYDLREYVPVGNCMAWNDGILYIVSQDSENIYRSVSGRPLDFVVNVTNTLTTAATTNKNGTAYWEVGGGDASTTSYSVGVGGISCIRPLSTGGIFVSASNANFSVVPNKTPNAPTIFNEYTFIRTFLFNATNLSDRTIIDSLGDTRFIELTGIRSFNAVEQLQNQGRNSVFSATVQKVLQVKNSDKLVNIVQDADNSAAILYDNYELYALTTAFGNAIAVYDTINQCWCSFDTTQTNGKRVKCFAKIELTVQALFAITEDDELYTLYSGTTNATPYVRTSAINECERSEVTGQSVRANDPKVVVKLNKFRYTVSNITKNCSFSITPFVDNRQSKVGTLQKVIQYVNPITQYVGPMQLDDVNAMLYNGAFSPANCEQGWCVYFILSWTDGSLNQYSVNLTSSSPENPLKAQSNANK